LTYYLYLLPKHFVVFAIATKQNFTMFSTADKYKICALKTSRELFYFRSLIHKECRKYVIKIFWIIYFSCGQHL